MPEPSVALSQAISRAKETGQVQWVARVELCPAFDAIECYAHCAAQDRFYWERVEAGERFVAFGRADEVESSGPTRFEDIDRWATDRRARLHWTGEARPATAPLFLGGFGFSDEAASVTEWKSFPAARFVMPETIGEELGGQTRWIEIVRVEPGCDVATVEAEWLRRADARTPSEPREAPLKQPSPDRALLPEMLPKPGAWPSGPEYRVRSDRPHSVFTDQVAAALATIEAGQLEKVVLARRLEVNHDGDLEIPVFISRLREMYPSCTIVAIGRGEDTFLAATPETLIRLRGDQVETVALAGSAPRGRTPEEDARFANELLSNPKEQAEHAHVVEAIRAALMQHCEHVEAAKQPSLRAILGIQHLETAISASLAARSDPEEDRPTGVLSLVAALHPTPAVGGVPRESAVEWLRRFEGLDRGWYAAPIGWLDANPLGGGGGDFSVALRSALIQGTDSEAEGSGRAWLFAGAGIVAGSNPEMELAETRIKLRALLAPLTEI